MRFKFREYEDIKNSLSSKPEDLVRLRELHSVVGVAQLPKHRRIPIEFIKIVAERLDGKKMDSDEKAQLFTGYLYLIAARIEGESLFGKSTSMLLKTLHNVIGLTKENQMDDVTLSTIHVKVCQDLSDFIPEVDKITGPVNKKLDYALNELERAIIKNESQKSKQKDGDAFLFFYNSTKAKSPEYEVKHSSAFLND